MVDIVTQAGQQIVKGAQLTPYNQDTLTVGANQIVDVFETFNFFRIYSLSASGLQVSFGDNGKFTDLVGAGIGIDFDKAIGRVTFKNTTAGAITITFAVSGGRIYDDRLTASGTITIAGTVDVNTVNNPVQVKQSKGFSTSQTTVSTSAVQLVTAAATNGLVTLYSGTSDLYIGETSGVTSANGFLIPSGGGFSFSNGIISDVYGIRSAGSATAYALIEDFV